MSDAWFDPSDAVDIPDEAEPWENRPDAVRTHEHEQLCDDDGWDHPGPCIIETDFGSQPRYDVTRRDASPHFEVWRVDDTGQRMALYIDTDEEAVQLAHAILSEVEIGRLP